MKKLLRYIANHKMRFVIGVSGVATLLWLMFYRIGSIVPGLSAGELRLLNEPVGASATFNDPFYLPIEIVRSALFIPLSDFGALVGRVPNALFGLLAVVCFAYIVWRWHGRRTALFATALFATSAWTLHVSRLASFDVLYLCAIPVLLCSGVLLKKHTNALVFYGSLAAWLMLLYIPGMIWLVALTIYWQRDALVDGWRHFSALWQRSLCILLVAVSLPLLIINILRPNQLFLWLGMPDQWEAPLIVLKQFAAVGVHLFIRGPEYPEVWLGKAPILDIFALVMCAIGIYFYARHIRAYRTKMLFSYALVGWLLVGLHGAVNLSLMVPLLYVFAAAGLAYLLREWLQVFPLNPFARGIGIALISIAVLFSCVYNLRAYFVAWPHNDTTQSIFRYDR